MRENIKKIPKNCDNAVQQFIITNYRTSCVVGENYNTFVVHRNSTDGEKCQCCTNFQKVKKDKKKYQQRWRWI